jgi:hypothetical protein
MKSIYSQKEMGHGMKKKERKKDLVLLRVVLLQPSLRVEGSHASSSGTGDSLAVLLVLNITGSKDTGDVGLGRARDSLDVTILVQVQLALEQRGGGDVTNGVEKTVDIHRAGLLSDSVLEDKGAEQLAVTLAFDGDGVVKNGDLRVGREAVSHDLGSTELVTADQNIDVRG